MKNKEMFFTPFIYEVKLGEGAEHDDKGFILYYKGERMTLNHPEIRFHEQEKISLLELAELLKGTKGIISVFGYFD